MKEFKPVQYGRWTIRTKKDGYFVFKVELDGDQVTEWLAVPSEANNKKQVVEYAKHYINQFLKWKVFQKQYHTRHFYGT